MNQFHLHLNFSRKQLKKFNREEDQHPFRMMESKQSTENIGLSNRPPQTNAEGKVQTVRVEQKIGRNDPCPCGSGKKYKQCHGK